MEPRAPVLTRHGGPAARHRHLGFHVLRHQGCRVPDEPDRLSRGQVRHRRRGSRRGVPPATPSSEWATLARRAGHRVAVRAGQIAQTIGLQTTAASVSGFITSVYVVLTPLVAWLVLRARPTQRIWVAVALATTGLGYWG
ncbi:DMT family transporter [Tessaracoccus sp. HDW20]|nr:DMT family transporter [Tessaracoccus coleopterorum]NHB85308.1 DMT family transporter [Tessaracoccus coleopterorum]